MTNTVLRLIVNRPQHGLEEIELPSPSGGDVHLHLHLYNDGNLATPTCPARIGAPPPGNDLAPARRTSRRSTILAGIGMLTAAVTLFELGSYSGAVGVRRQSSADQVAGANSDSGLSAASPSAAELLAQLQRKPTVEPAAPATSSPPPAAPLPFGLQP